MKAFKSRKSQEVALELGAQLTFNVSKHPEMKPSGDCAND